MRWAIKHKSGRALFVTSDEFIANNRRELCWVVEEVMMTSREQFEKFIMSVAGNVSMQTFRVHDAVYYKDAHIQGMWRAWEASRAAIEVATPWLCGDGDNDNEWTQGYNDGVMATEKAIINAGLKVKK